MKIDAVGGQLGLGFGRCEDYGTTDHGTTGPEEMRRAECGRLRPASAGQGMGNGPSAECGAQNAELRMQEAWWWVNACLDYAEKMGKRRRTEGCNFVFAGKVMDRIRRRYRKRFGRRADWRGYVAKLVGVSACTVGAWRIGTQRPTRERMRVLRKISASLGRKAGTTGLRTTGPLDCGTRDR